MLHKIGASNFAVCVILLCFGFANSHHAIGAPGRSGVGTITQARLLERMLERAPTSPSEWGSAQMFWSVARDCRSRCNPFRSREIRGSI